MKSNLRTSPNLADPGNEPTQRDWQRLAARALRGVEQRHALAMAQMLARIDQEVAQAQKRAEQFASERRAA